MSKRFVIITHAPHKTLGSKVYSYRPYIIEMNLWLQYVEQCKIIAPVVSGNPTEIDDFYQSEHIHLDAVPSFDITNFKNFIKSIVTTPIIIYKIFKAFLWADHIHLRCPGNMGLLGAIVQIFFPSKKKTVKYAGNWDPDSKQPKSYVLQKKILSNTFLTKNCKVLVYGNWKNQSKNIVPFFTATYRKKDIINIKKPSFTEGIQLIFVGQFSMGKQPMLSVKVCQELSKTHLCHLHMYGDGVLFDEVSSYIETNDLSDRITLHGKASKEVVQKAFMESHFLIFISKSEGWPKVVAESMFWGCIPFSSKVSCVPSMLNHGERGELVDENIDIILQKLNQYIIDIDLYGKKSKEAMNWSRQFTLDKFEQEIKVLLSEEN